MASVNSAKDDFSDVRKTVDDFRDDKGVLGFGRTCNQLVSSIKREARGKIDENTIIKINNLIIEHNAGWFVYLFGNAIALLNIKVDVNESPLSILTADRINNIAMLNKKNIEFNHGFHPFSARKPIFETALEYLEHMAPLQLKNDIDDFLTWGNASDDLLCDTLGMIKESLISAMKLKTKPGNKEIFEEILMKYQNCLNRVPFSERERFKLPNNLMAY